jgi:hypothetical protein
MKNNLEDVFQTIADITNPYKNANKIYSLKSIMLPRFLSCIDEFGNVRNVKFLVEGQRVILNKEGNELQDINDATPTHQITHCWTINETLSVTVIDLKTQELKFITL